MILKVDFSVFHCQHLLLTMVGNNVEVQQTSERHLFRSSLATPECYAVSVDSIATLGTVPGTQQCTNLMTIGTLISLSSHSVCFQKTKTIRTKFSGFSNVNIIIRNSYRTVI